MTVKKYTINGKKYTQRQLVLGQISLLTEAIRGVEIPQGAGVGGVAGLLGDRLPRCAAIVLQPSGVKHRDKDIEALADEFAEYLDLQTTEEVLDDFFTLTPAATIAKLLARLRGMFVMARLGIGGTGLLTPSSSLPEETSPNETKSSGATP